MAARIGIPMIRRASLLAAAVISVMAGTGWCFEPADRFLAGLRERGYHDMALEYLRRMPQNPAVSEQAKSQVDYEWGLTHVQLAMSTGRAAERERHLDEAERALKRFCEQHADHQLAASATNYLASLLIERARWRADQALTTDASDQQEQLVHESQRLFREAYQILERNREDLRNRLQQLPRVLEARKDDALIQTRDQWRHEYRQTRLRLAQIQYQQAQLQKPSPEAYRTALEEAEAEFADVAKDYRKRIEGVEALYFQGLCRRDRGDMEGAIALLTEILEIQDPNPSLLPLHAKALQAAMPCWLDKQVADVNAAIQQAEKWLRTQPVRSVDPGGPGLEIRLWLARAYLAKAAQPNEPNGSRLREEARTLARRVASVTSPVQQQAQQLLAQLGQQPLPAVTIPETANTFAEAKEAATKLFQLVQEATTTVKLLEDRLASITDSTARSQLEQQINQAQQQLTDSRFKAVQVFRHALQLADDSVPADDVNTARYYLAFLHYAGTEYYESAVLGQFVATRYPSFHGAEDMARISLSAYAQLVNSAPAPARQPLTRHVANVAELIAQRWPQTGDDALIMLIQLAVQQRQEEEAEARLAAMAQTSPRRGEAELLVGQAYWHRYLRQRAADQEPANTAATLALREKARQYLTDGLERMREKRPDETVTRAALALVHVLLDNQQIEQAIVVLEDPVIGPMVQLARQPQASYAAEAHKLAIRSYVAALGSAGDTKTFLTKALKSLKALESSAPANGQQASHLISLYVDLAADLRDQIEQAPAQTRPALVHGLLQFLRSASQATDQLAVELWIGQSLVEVGHWLAKDNASQEAGLCFDEAVLLYQRVLDHESLPAGALDEATRLRIRLQLAAAYREQAEFARAIDLLSDLVAVNENLLDVQVQAAQTFQAWGDHGEAGAYRKAIMGQHMGPQKSHLWGWGRISQITARYPKHRDTFHQARYNLARCRYQYALTQPPAQRTQTLEMAMQDILLTYRLYPELGDAERKSAYDQLLKQIQRALNETPTGLAGIQSEHRP